MQLVRPCPQGSEVFPREAQLDRSGCGGALLQPAGHDGHAGKRLLGPLPDPVLQRLDIGRGRRPDQQLSELRCVGLAGQVVVEGRRAPPHEGGDLVDCFMAHERGLEHLHGGVCGVEVRAFSELDLHHELVAVATREELARDEWCERHGDDHHAERPGDDEAGVGHGPAGHTRPEGGPPGPPWGRHADRSRAEGQGGHHRGEGHRHAEAHDEGEDDELGDGPSEVSARPLGQQQGEEAGHGRAGGRCERECQSLHGGDGGVPRGVPLIDPPLDLLGDHDGVVDQQAQAEHKRRDADLLQDAARGSVQRQAGEGHHRDHDGHHTAQAQAHGHDEHPGHHEDTLCEAPAQVGEPVGHAGGLVGDDRERQGRHLGPQRVEHGVHVVAEGHDIDAGGGHDAEGDRDVSVDAHPGRVRIDGALADVGQGRQGHRRAVGPHDDGHRSERICRRDHGGRIEGQAPAARDHGPARTGSGARRQSGGELSRGHPEAPGRGLVEGHHDLLARVGRPHHVADSRDPPQPGLRHLGRIPQDGPVVGAVHRHDDGLEVGQVGVECPWQHIGGKGAGGVVEGVLHVVPDRIGVVDGLRELDRDDGHVRSGGDLDVLDLGHGDEGFLDRFGHLPLHP